MHVWVEINSVVVFIVAKTLKIKILQGVFLWKWPKIRYYNILCG